MSKNPNLLWCSFSFCYWLSGDVYFSLYRARFSLFYPKYLFFFLKRGEKNANNRCWLASQRKSLDSVMWSVYPLDEEDNQSPWKKKLSTLGSNLVQIFDLFNGTSHCCRIFCFPLDPPHIHTLQENYLPISPLFSVTAIPVFFPQKLMEWYKQNIFQKTKTSVVYSFFPLCLYSHGFFPIRNKCCKSGDGSFFFST